jgi:hypothetical protein
MPLYDITTHLASFDPPPPELTELLAAVHGHQEGMDRFLSVISGTIPPGEFVEYAQRLVRESDAA